MSHSERSCKIKPFPHFEHVVVKGSGVVFTSTLSLNQRLLQACKSGLNTVLIIFFILSTDIYGFCFIEAGLSSPCFCSAGT